MSDDRKKIDYFDWKIQHIEWNLIVGLIGCVGVGLLLLLAFCTGFFK